MKLTKNTTVLLFIFLFLINCFFTPVFPETDATRKENEKVCLLKGYVSKVPGGTRLKIIFETPLSEETNKIDDEVTARIAEDVVVNGGVILPSGSTVIGKISEINQARRMHRAGNVRIEFKNLTTPDGRQIPIVASVLTRSGLLKGKYNKKTALISSASVVTPIAAGLGIGLAAEGSAVGAGIGAILGLVAGIGLFAFERGNMIDIMAGDELTIELTEEALVPSVSDKKDSEIENSDASNIENKIEEKEFNEE